VRLADVLGVDLGEAVWRKLSDNAARYPANEVKGFQREATMILSVQHHCPVI
jgi:hypothetical protein